MRAIVKRDYKREDYTIGRVYIDGEFFCHSLEPEDRGLQQNMDEKDILRLKVPGKTAIPSGVYKVKMSRSPKYKRVMPEVLGVKGFIGIRIHSGNSADDTEGCILLGDNSADDTEGCILMGDNTQKGRLTGSRERCREFERRLKAAGGSCYMEIR